MVAKPLTLLQLTGSNWLVYYSCALNALMEHAVLSEVIRFAAQRLSSRRQISFGELA
ncbi:hypothetical protein [Candidatus Doolittlea endobia]|uniref:hypothetical protein n=1 Tax=Candidatus Doolittlea endobia TaxID=1778262 RepID=UPI0018D30F9E|nr:hypothetical protein [Candidatus Doolittlea endobia]